MRMDLSWVSLILRDNIMVSYSMAPLFAWHQRLFGMTHNAFFGTNHTPLSAWCFWRSFLGRSKSCQRGGENCESKLRENYESNESKILSYKVTRRKSQREWETKPCEWKPKTCSENPGLGKALCQKLSCAFDRAMKTTASARGLQTPFGVLTRR